MKRIPVLLAAGTTLSLLAGCSDKPEPVAETEKAAEKSSAMANQDPLAFPPQGFVEETLTVKTDAGEQTITVHRWNHLLYVSKPVDADYQSLDVQVPVAINGKPIDASGAPIVLNIKIGGYRSVNNRNPDAGMGRGPRGMQPPGAGMADGPDGKPGEHGPRGDMPPQGQFADAGGQPPQGQDFPGQRPEGEGAPDQRPGGQHDDQQRPGAENGKPSRGLAMGMGMGSDKANLALAAGYVVVTPGARGIDNQRDGKPYGMAPAGIVDLKAAVRYLRHNDAAIPGNSEWIVSAGCSAGGAMSALLGASGNNSWYQPYLDEIGAANAPDNIFASACYSPITDINHSDGSYEWFFGQMPVNGQLVDQTLSAELSNQYEAYQQQLALSGLAGADGKPGEAITAANYAEYFTRTWLQPSATAYLQALPADQRDDYLAQHGWIHWDGQQATLAFADYRKDMTRMKGLPAFDDFEMKAPETQLFATGTDKANHFTEFSLRHSAGDNAQLDEELQQRINHMNAMYFTDGKQSDVAQHWWLRNGSHDNNNAPIVMTNLALSLENHGKNVNSAEFWGGGHCADDDPQGMVNWIGQITGYQR